MRNAPKVVICGSFRKDPAGLGRLFSELETTGCRILSPLTLNFSDDFSKFVVSDNDTGFSVSELERFHLRAIKEADFIMLHAPDGYVGTSASYELGYAAACNIPVFSKHPVNDTMLASQLQRTNSVFEALECLD